MVLITPPFVTKNIDQGGTDGNTTDFLVFYNFQNAILHDLIF